MAQLRKPEKKRKASSDEWPAELRPHHYDKAAPKPGIKGLIQQFTSKTPVVPKKYYCVSEGKILNNAGGTITRFPMHTKALASEARGHQKNGYRLVWILALRVTITITLPPTSSTVFTTRLYDCRINREKAAVLASITHNAQQPVVHLVTAVCYPITIDDFQKDIFGLGTCISGSDLIEGYTPAVYTVQTSVKFGNGIEQQHFMYQSLFDVTPVGEDNDTMEVTNVELDEVALYSHPSTSLAFTEMFNRVIVSQGGINTNARRSFEGVPRGISDDSGRYDDNPSMTSYQRPASMRAAFTNPSALQASNRGIQAAHHRNCPNAPKPIKPDANTPMPMYQKLDNIEDYEMSLHGKPINANGVGSLLS